LSSHDQEFVEIFLQEASEHLQFLREYSGILQDAYPVPEDVERLYISAHTLSGTSASYGFPHFSEVAGKLAHIFQYAMNASISPDASGALVEFISEAVAVLESDLILVSTSGQESLDDINSFKAKYPFAFQAPAATQPASHPQEIEPEPSAPPENTESSGVPIETQTADLPPDAEVPDEILEFFVPEAEEHLQIVQECLLALEANPNSEDINRLFRAMHTVKGSAAQVGLQRIARVAHRAEDLIGRLRDGILHPSAQIVDLCLESVDVLKKFLYRQWPNEDQMQAAVRSLLARIAQLAPEEAEENESEQVGEPGTKAQTREESAAAEIPAIESQQEHPGDSPLEAQPAPLSEAAQEKSEEVEILPGKRELAAVPQSKSVRISLERLDRMMNAVGELVINRTRMLGRLAELERLADVLNFSKARMSDKITEFQEKYEFSRLTSSQPERQHYLPPELSLGGPAYPYRGGFSSYSMGYDASLAEFSELEMDRYDDFSILSRSLTEISADITEVLTQLDGFVRRVDSDIDEFTKLAHRLQDEITQARMVPIGNLYSRLSRTVRDAAKAAN
jgi:chemosensory pili system protein ChpA (sensor histidine kinase/response regulator)